MVRQWSTAGPPLFSQSAQRAEKKNERESAREKACTKSKRELRFRSADFVVENGPAT